MRKAAGVVDPLLTPRTRSLCFKKASETVSSAVDMSRRILLSILQAIPKLHPLRPLVEDEVSDAYERMWMGHAEAEQDRLITEQSPIIIHVANGIFQALTRNKDQKSNRDASIIIEAHLKPGDNHEAQIWQVWLRNSNQIYLYILHTA